MSGIPKPTAIKALRGTLRPDRMNRAEPTPVVASGKPPAWLKGPARRNWLRLAPMLTRLGVLTEADEDMLAQLCTALAETVTCTRVVETFGPTYETTNRLGERMVKARPEVAMRAEARRAALLYAGRFGLTPADRGRIVAQAEKDVDPFDVFLAGSVG